ncbi:Aste57867_2828 [Aphanomyces stellatus]|uniref:Aste57867_2828 protein n=1 Tax=Aphanomyces stellatus TaxID=120398 RepID=A0A485K9G6_9STRA|nr:hypothetical protein As57867_002821 [Aphanomyces stellatus]VFT80016.1 Aste57867_2828 [Aphanomyces stellatus]
MEGNGAYNKAATCQAGVTDATHALLTTAVQRFAAAYPTKTRLCIADLGVSQGRNALGLHAHVLGTLDAAMAAPPEVLLLLEDQPSNDFATLLATLNSPASVVHARSHTYTGVIARSFYDRLVPQASVDMFLSYIALQWLAAVPTPLPQSMMHINDPSRQAMLSAADKATWQRAQHAHLVSFLRHRAVELVDYGMLSLTFVSHHGDETLYHILVIARALEDMVARGLLSQASLDRLALCVYLRSTDEALAAFADVPELELCEYDQVPMQFPFQSGAGAASFFLSIMKPSFQAAMTDDERNDPYVLDCLASCLATRFTEHVVGSDEPYFRRVPLNYFYASFTRVPR